MSCCSHLKPTSDSTTCKLELRSSLYSSVTDIKSAVAIRRSLYLLPQVTIPTSKYQLSDPIPPTYYIQQSKLQFCRHCTAAERIESAVVDNMSKGQHSFLFVQTEQVTHRYVIHHILITTTFMHVCDLGKAIGDRNKQIL